MNQIKKAPNFEQKTALDALSAVWNPLLLEIKVKRANAERAFDLLNQLETSLKLFTAQLDENRSLLKVISENKVNFYKLPPHGLWLSCIYLNARLKKSVPS